MRVKVPLTLEALESWMMTCCAHVCSCGREASSLRGSESCCGAGSRAQRPGGGWVGLGSVRQELASPAGEVGAQGGRLARWLAGGLARPWCVDRAAAIRRGGVSRARRAAAWRLELGGSSAGRRMAVAAPPLAHHHAPASCRPSSSARTCRTAKPGRPQPRRAWDGLLTFMATSMTLASRILLRRHAAQLPGEPGGKPSTQDCMIVLRRHTAQPPGKPIGASSSNTRGITPGRGIAQVGL
jgi:hypothetical protein